MDICVMSKFYPICLPYNELQSCSRCCFISFFPREKGMWVSAGARPGLQCSDWSPSLPSTGSPLQAGQAFVYSAALQAVSISDQEMGLVTITREMGDI